MHEVITARGLFSSFYSDRGSHYWTTPEADGKADKENLTQFGRAMKQLGIDMIAAYSPEARGRSERPLAPIRALAAGTGADGHHRHGGRQPLPAGALPSRLQRRVCRAGAGSGSASVPWIGGSLEDILCEQYERVVGNDNCVRFEGMSLQIPADRHRCHYVKARVRVKSLFQWGARSVSRPTRLGLFHARRETLLPRSCNRPPEPSATRASWGRSPAGLRPRRFPPPTEKADNSCATEPDKSKNPRQNIRYYTNRGITLRIWTPLKSRELTDRFGS